MQKTACHIVGSGSFDRRAFHPYRGDLIIAADGGCDHIKEAGYIPHLLIGDMDSIRSIPTGIAKLCFPRRKDDTDVGLALKIAFSHGYRDFVLHGVSGSRLDHFYANAQLMAAFSRKGAFIRAEIENGTLAMVTNGCLTIGRLVPGTCVSVFSVCGTASGVTLYGLKYPLQNARLSCLVPLGVSNEAMSEDIKISVRNGTLAVFIERVS